MPLNITVLDRDKHSSLVGSSVSYGEKCLIKIALGAIFTDNTYTTHARKNYSA
jgi:hypothetical protein